MGSCMYVCMYVHVCLAHREVHVNVKNWPLDFNAEMKEYFFCTHSHSTTDFVYIPLT